MKVAIMQPYFFPYLGYFQLIQAVDTFVFYDDVNFIKGGWIHRNRLLFNKDPHFFSIPLVKQSSFIRIDDMEINKTTYTHWKEKLLKSIQINYATAPYFDDILKMVSGVLETDTNKLSNLAILSVQTVMNYLEVDKKCFKSSQGFHETKPLKKADRLIEITKRLNGTEYINLPGGKELYDKDYFKSKDVQLSFLNPQLPEYIQFGNPFQPGLSIIDVLMFNSREQVRELLKQYTLE